MKNVPAPHHEQTVTFVELLDVAKEARLALIQQARGDGFDPNALAEYARRFDPFTVCYLLEELAALSTFREQVQLRAQQMVDSANEGDENPLTRRFGLIH